MVHSIALNGRKYLQSRFDGHQKKLKGHSDDVIIGLRNMGYCSILNTFHFISTFFQCFCVKRQLTSQNIVNLSSGSRPFASSNRKSRLINFLKPQSLPCTNLYARCDSIALVSSRFAFNIENLNFALTSDLLHDTNNKYNDR